MRADTLAKKKRGSPSNEGINQQLFFAIKKQDHALVQQALKQGAEVNCKPPRGRDETPLMQAARIGDSKIVQTLIEAKADPNIKTFHGLTAADFAESSSLQALLRNPTY